jgi:hypothetical protein
MLYEIFLCLTIPTYVDVTFKAIQFPTFAVGIVVVIAGLVLEGKKSALFLATFKW